jgi:3',5'-cyclic AMP phosphodiesterase CpdA
MTPAFHSTRHAFVFGGVILFFLTLPMVLHGIGGVSLEESFHGISERAGDFDRIGHEIFQDRSDLDVFLCGSSLLDSAADPELMRREMSNAIGHPVKTLLLRQAWQGPDMNYFVARALMEHRRVKILVIAAPAWVQRSDQPHVQLFRVVRYGDYAGALDGLGFRSRLAVYADYVLGAPRQALSLLRLNLIAPDAGRATGTPVSLGYQGGPFVPHEAFDPAVQPSESIDSEKSRDLFHFDGPPLSPYQFHFLRKTAELAREHGALLVILHLPSPSERGSMIVSDRKLMPGVFGDGVFFVGVPSARLFHNVPDSEFLDYYTDEHVNLNGSDLFTRAITPALIEIYERQSEAR